MLLQPPVRHVAAVAGQHFRLRQVGDRAVLVGIAEDELAGLQRRARAGRGLLARSLHHRLRQPVPEAEVVVGVVERRRRVQIQIRQPAHAVAPGDQLVVRRRGPGVLGVVAREQDRDRVQVVAGQSADPVVRVVAPGVAEDVGPGGHALAELLREGRERLLGHPERAQARSR